MNTQTRTCPKCGSDWDGGSILETYIKQREEGSSYWEGKSDQEIEEHVKEGYGPPYRWGREIGIELPFDHPDHYDGVSYWECPDCKARFDRWTMVEVTEDIFPKINEQHNPT